MTQAVVDVLALAREQVLERGLTFPSTGAGGSCSCRTTVSTRSWPWPTKRVLRWCGPEVEAEGIISLKTGGCPEDCHFCSQSGLFASPVRSAWLDVPSLVEAAKQTAKSGRQSSALSPQSVAPMNGCAQVAAGIEAIRNEVDIHIACLAGHAEPGAGRSSGGHGVHRYNHNLETSRSFFPNVVTTHTGRNAGDPADGPRRGYGGMQRRNPGMGETLEQRAEFAANLAELDPHEVPLNFLNPRPGTPFGDLDVLPASEALRAVAAFRLALPRTMLRFAGGREITLGDLGAKKGILGGINAVIVGNYTTTLGRPAEADLELPKTFRCRSRHSTPACRRWKMLENLPCARGAPAFTTCTPVLRMLIWAPPTFRPPPSWVWNLPLLRRLRAAHGGSGPPGRLVGRMLTSRRVDSKDLDTRR